MDAKMTDAVNHPSHYARYRFECEPKDLTKYLPHPLASAIEYILRSPFKGSELEDLKKARFWLLEFANTSDFWSVPIASDPGTLSCKLLPDMVDPWKVTACAFALMSQCLILQKGLFNYVSGKYDFPRTIYKEQVQELIYKLNSKIESLESKSKPSESE